MGAGCRADHRALGCDLAGRSLALMGTRYYFAAPLFVLDAALTVIVAVTLLVVAFAR